MGKGGKRAGAGRKWGSLNKATIERQQRAAAIAAKAEAAGLLPLDVMLDNMRDFWARANAQPEKDGQRNLAFAKLAHEAARDAAPYIHAKLASVEANG